MLEVLAVVRERAQEQEQARRPLLRFFGSR
jgi:hypothetical protein